MEKDYPIAPRIRIVSLFLPIALFLSLVLADPCGAQMGVATGNGVATPAKPLPAGMKPPVVRYEDVAAQADLAGINVSGVAMNKQYIVETTGTGVAIFDYDNDGLPDIFFVNGDRFQSSGAPPTPLLYHNLGGLKFEDVTSKAGLSHTGWGQGVCAGDIDNDGNVDLFMTQWGHNVLYRNQGNGTFHNETQFRGLDSSKTRWSTGCAFVDFNRDGALDLVVVHYIEFDPARTPHPACRFPKTSKIRAGQSLAGFPILDIGNDVAQHLGTRELPTRNHGTTRSACRLQRY